MSKFQQAAACLLAGLLLWISGCGTPSDPAQVAEAYAAQRSVNCTVRYQVTLDAVIDGVRFKDLEQELSADAQVNLVTGEAHLRGEVNTFSGGETVGSVQVEAYAVPEDGEAKAFYRYGAAYYAGSEEYNLLTLINLPRSLNLSSGYRRQEGTEILLGAECDVYTGREIADGSCQSILIGQARTEFSLEGCLMDVTLRAYKDTSLPAQLEIDYSNLDEMEVSLTDSQGNTYTVTSLHFEVVYSGYGTVVEVELPDSFRNAALSGETGEDPVRPLNPDGKTLDELLGGTVSGFTGDADADFSGSYFIFNDDSSYFYVVNTPEFMALDQQERDQVSFYYFYAGNDFELITYCLCSDFDGKEESDYAEKLPSIYRQQDGISGVSAEGIQSVTIGDYRIKYNLIHFTLEAEGEVYKAVDLYSWVEAPDGSGCLELGISEYNASGDGVFFDPVEELQYAYGAILGGGAFRAD